VKARDAFRADSARGYVCGFCRGQGHNRRTCPQNPDKAMPRVTDSRSQQAARLAVESGISIAEAARRFGIARQAVSQVIWRFQAVRT
jgi:transposase-like protein